MMTVQGMTIFALKICEKGASVWFRIMYIEAVEIILFIFHKKMILHLIVYRKFLIAFKAIRQFIPEVRCRD